MATYTQHKQPYGPLSRCEITINGDEYVVVRVNRTRHGVLFAYHKTWRPGLKPTRTLGSVCVWERENTEATMLDAIEKVRGNVEMIHAE